MEMWRKVFRQGVLPGLGARHLEVLRKALVEDSPQLLQGATTTPPPLQCVSEWPVEAACPLAYVGWKGDGLKTVADVEQFFACACYEIDQRLGEPAGCRWFLNWYDETPRDEMRKLLLEEVELALGQQSSVA